MTGPHDTIAQTHAHMTTVCFSVSGYEPSPILLNFSRILLNFSRFSAQISGFSAELDIVNQHPNNAKIWADSVF